MKLDENPKGMALIMLAIGLFGIGVILTLGFYGNTTLLGVGVTMSVVGGAGAILGCIHMGSVQKKKALTAEGIAPPRIPPPTEIVFQDSVMAPDEDLHYEPFSASPPRTSERFSPPGASRSVVIDPSWVNWGEPAGIAAMRGTPVAIRDGSGTPVRATSVVPTMGAAGAYNIGPLSPFERRSFPVPPALPMSSAGNSPNNNVPVYRGGTTATQRPLPPGAYGAAAYPQQSDALAFGGGIVPGSAARSTSSAYRRGASAGPEYFTAAEMVQPIGPGPRFASYDNNFAARAAPSMSTNSAMPAGSRNRLGDYAEDDDALPEHYWSPN